MQNIREFSVVAFFVAECDEETGVDTVLTVTCTASDGNECWKFCIQDADGDLLDAQDPDMLHDLYDNDEEIVAELQLLAGGAWVGVKAVLDALNAERDADAEGDTDV